MWLATSISFRGAPHGISRCTPFEIRRWPRVPGERSETRDLGATRRTFQLSIDFAAWPWVPALRSLTLARPGHKSVGAAYATLVGSLDEPCAVNSSHDVKQRSLVRSRGALLRPGWSLSIRTRPEEGWAERRQAHLFCCRVCETRRIRASEARRVP